MLPAPAPPGWASARVRIIPAVQVGVPAGAGLLEPLPVALLGLAVELAEEDGVDEPDAEPADPLVAEVCDVADPADVVGVPDPDEPVVPGPEAVSLPPPQPASVAASSTPAPASARARVDPCAVW